MRRNPQQSWKMWCTWTCPVILLMALGAGCADDTAGADDAAGVADSGADAGTSPDGSVVDVATSDVPADVDVSETEVGEIDTSDLVGSDATEDDVLRPLPALAEPPALTTDVTLRPVHPDSNEDRLDPRVPEEVDQLVAAGFGEVEIGQGEPYISLTLDGSQPPALGSDPIQLLRIVHLADAQLVDDESPTRAAGLDLARGPTRISYRAQEAYQCHLLNAAVRTINGLHAEGAIDFVLLGGDNIDNAQQNELDWLQAILDGADAVACDSGIDDDPAPGASNDPKDPFVPVGLDVPWLWVTGNHDILVQGIFPIEGASERAVGTQAANGTRDWSQAGGPVARGEVPADSNRMLLSREQLLTTLLAGGSIGLPADIESRGKANYVYDLPESPIRLIVIDSGAETGGSSGVVHGADVETFLRPALEAAAADERWVIVTSHHASGSMNDGSDIGGIAQDDALTTDEFRDLLGAYDNVILHLAGHSHRHRVRVIEPPDGGHAFWEVQTSALSDLPQQMRLIEVFDQGNGYLTISGTALDFAVDGDVLAAMGRTLGVIDVTSEWESDGSGSIEDRNVRLFFPTE